MAIAGVKKIQKADRPDRPKEIYIEEKNVDQIQLSPDGKTVTFRLTKTSGAKTTIVPSYVTESGFTEDISSRTKVGAPQNVSELWVYSIAKDTVLAVKTNDIPGINDPTDFSKDYKVKPVKEPAKDDKAKDKKPESRPITLIPHLLQSNAFSIAFAMGFANTSISARYSSGKSKKLSISFFGTTNVCPFTRGNTSRKAKNFSFSAIL